MVELALALPLFIVVLFGVIVFGITIFLHQQVTNAAREGARYAAIHSATAQCPTVPTLDPMSAPLTYVRCDRPDMGWPNMTAAARERLFGLNKTEVRVAACWSGYRQATNWDAWVPGTYDVGGTAVVVSPADSVFTQCDIDAQDPTDDGQVDQIGCTTGLATTDEASAMSESKENHTGNTVTAYACYVWNPPLGGIGIPIPCSTGWCSMEIIQKTLVLRAVVTEAIQRQQ
ncbi:MAG: TadE family protein [Chloroflexota bacterium]